MADEAKGIPGWVWAIVAVVVLYYLSKKLVTGAAATAGKNIGSGAVDAAFKDAGKVASTLGSFVGGLFGSGKSGAGPGGQSAAFTADTSLHTGASAADLAAQGFDTSNYSVSEGFQFTDDSGNAVFG